MIDNIDDLRFIVLYTNMIISMNKNYENLINNLKNKIVEGKFIFSIDYLNKKLPDELIHKISTYLQFICYQYANGIYTSIKKIFIQYGYEKNLIIVLPPTSQQ